jgi:hypothetical protein
VASNREIEEKRRRRREQMDVRGKRNGSTERNQNILNLFLGLGC